MVVQHNLPALNALRQKTINNAYTSKNLEKLSSGLRINRAADDAAGLGISEKMRGQIRGLEMASQNTRHGINLIRTAEGGLNEVHAILHRMRELGVQASNGTYQQDDREQISKEVEALKSEIDRIAGSTHYNGLKLLNGTLGGYSASSLPGGGGCLPGSYAALAAQLDKMGFAVQVTGNPASVSDSTISIEIFDSAIKGANANLIVTSPTDSMDPDYRGRLTLQIGDKTYVGKFIDSPNSFIDADGAPVNAPGDIPENVYVFLDHDGKLVATLENKTSTTYGPVTDKPPASFLDPFVPASSGIITGIPLMAKGNASFIIGGSPVPAADMRLVAPNPLSGIMVGNKDSKLEFQIGANGHADQRVGLHVPNMSSGNLGTGIATSYNASGLVADVDIFTVEQANDALVIIDAAIIQAAGVRAQLGSLENRLEHTLMNLGVTTENLTASESTIRDVDMAKEMMEFTKNNILNEASQAMLAQANQLPQGILSLLR